MSTTRSSAFRLTTTLGFLIVLFAGFPAGCGKQNCTDSCQHDDDCYDGLICRNACVSFLGSSCKPKLQCVPKECDNCPSKCSFTQTIGGSSDSSTCSAGSCSGSSSVRPRLGLASSVPDELVSSSPPVERSEGVEDR